MIAHINCPRSPSPPPSHLGPPTLLCEHVLTAAREVYIEVARPVTRSPVPSQQPGSNGHLHGHSVQPSQPAIFIVLCESSISSRSTAIAFIVFRCKLLYPQLAQLTSAGPIYFVSDEEVNFEYVLKARPFPKRAMDSSLACSRGRAAIHSRKPTHNTLRHLRQPSSTALGARYCDQG